MTALQGLLVCLAVAMWPGRSAGAAMARVQLALGAPLPRSRFRVAGRVVGARRRRRPARETESIAEFAEIVALCLRAGLPAERALDLAASGSAGDVPEGTSPAATVGQLAVALRTGHGHDAWAGHPAHLLLVAWALSRDRGAPLTDAAQTCASVLRDVDAAHRRELAASAGPQASMGLLTVLPLAGPLAALLIGVDVRATYATPVAAASVLVGLVLTAVGWVVSRRLLAHARRPEEIR